MSEESQTPAPQEDRLYAGKFKTLEELEKGYENSFGVHLKNKELETKLNELTNIPNEYSIPVGVELSQNKINEISYISKESQMTQQQFSNAIKAASIEEANRRSSLLEKQATIGEQKTNMIKTYLDNNFKEFNEQDRQEFFVKALSNDNTMEAIMNDRDRRLNSSIPGIDQNSIPNLDSGNSLENEFHKAMEDSLNNSRDMNARNRAIELANQLAKQQAEQKK